MKKCLACGQENPDYYPKCLRCGREYVELSLDSALSSGPGRSGYGGGGAGSGDDYCFWNAFSPGFTVLAGPSLATFFHVLNMILVVILAFGLCQLGAPYYKFMGSVYEYSFYAFVVFVSLLEIIFTRIILELVVLLYRIDSKL